MTFLFEPPGRDEYGEFYEGYVARSRSHPDVLGLLSEQPGRLDYLATFGEAVTATPLALGEWSAKQIVGHLCDFERMFAYRALRISRGDTTPIEGFEQDQYVAASNFNERPIHELLDEFATLRRATLMLYHSLPVEAFPRGGTASGMGVTVRALVYITAGHFEGHLADLLRDYPPQS